MTEGLNLMEHLSKFPDYSAPKYVLRNLAVSKDAAHTTFAEDCIKWSQEHEKLLGQVVSQIPNELDLLCEDLHDFVTRKLGLKGSGYAKKFQPIVWTWYEERIKALLEGSSAEDAIGKEVEQHPIFSPKKLRKKKALRERNNDQDIVTQRRGDKETV